MTKRRRHVGGLWRAVSILTAAAVVAAISGPIVGASSVDDASQQASSTGALVADFAYGPHPPTVNDEIQFIDRSTGSAEWFWWNFGDRASTDDRFPTHRFAQPGDYRVHFTACSKADGCDRSIQTITVGPSGSVAPLAGPIAFDGRIVSDGADPLILAPGQHTIVTGDMRPLRVDASFLMVRGPDGRPLAWTESKNPAHLWATSKLIGEHEVVYVGCVVQPELRCATDIERFVVPAPLPTVDVGLRYTGYFGSPATLEWTDLLDEDSFRLYRSSPDIPRLTEPEFVQEYPANAVLASFAEPGSESAVFCYDLRPVIDGVEMDGERVCHDPYRVGIKRITPTLERLSDDGHFLLTWEDTDTVAHHYNLCWDTPDGSETGFTRVERDDWIAMGVNLDGADVWHYAHRFRSDLDTVRAGVVGDVINATNACFDELMVEEIPPRGVGDPTAAHPVIDTGRTFLRVGEETSFDLREPQTFGQRVLWDYSGGTFRWDFGDGSSAEGVRVTHHFQRPGDFDVTLNIEPGPDSAVNAPYEASTRVRVVPVDDPTVLNPPTRVRRPPTHSFGGPLTWTDNAVGEDGYRVYRVWYPDSGGQGMVATFPADSTAIKTTPFLLATFRGGEIYNVVAVKDGFEGPAGAGFTERVPGGDLDGIDRAAISAVPGAQPGSVVLTVTAPTFEDHFSICGSGPNPRFDSLGPRHVVTQGDANQTYLHTVFEQTVTGLTSGTTAWFGACEGRGTTPPRLTVAVP